MGTQMLWLGGAITVYMRSKHTQINRDTITEGTKAIQQYIERWVCNGGDGEGSNRRGYIGVMMGWNIWGDIEVGFREHHYADQEMVCVVVGLGKDGSIQRGMWSLRVRGFKEV